MARKTLASLGFLLILLFAGCLDGDGDGDGADDGTGGDGGAGGNGGSGGDGNATQNRTLPEQLEFTFGPSLGCEGATAQGACVSFQAGPGVPAVDGFWVALGEPYWGLSFTSTISTVTGDSDCYFVNDALEITGDASQGASPCAGTVPDGAAYLFLYPYVEPSQGMTMTFTVPE